jgi:hypothetical protein
VKRTRRERPKLIDRWWVRLLVAAWIITIVVVYFRLQILRLIEIGSGRPG